MNFDDLIRIEKLNIKKLQSTEFRYRFKILEKEFTNYFGLMEIDDNEETQFIFIAIDSSNYPVGLVFCDFQEGSNISIPYLFVKSSHRYRRIGSKLLQKVKEVAYKYDYETISLNDESSNKLEFQIEYDKKNKKLEKNFYNKNGFKNESQILEYKKTFTVKLQLESFNPCGIIFTSGF
ncbi:hypothetical protein SD28_01370 [Allofrancisella guangzhouensis]|uniref:N-acetyltransferase domain-containing protein n=2 Tax=Allofrancisella guangzhouensis TaxID=594679 RepID=A0A0A8E8C3_9GAMM|nr:GNAT family N-acetyltransferase [Allofrancisella guangzhouensis]AJC48401.1 hypothetical protein SD28_01370 [Allofrancisella guangzhouensis]